jgi:hypothetical protein
MIIIDKRTAEELQRLSLNRRAPNDTSSANLNADNSYVAA